METYREFKNRQQQEFNNFPMFYAFSDSQFKKGMESIGLNPSDTDKIYKFGDSGGFYKRSDSQKLIAMLDRFDDEMKEAMKDDSFVIDMFRNELADHEFCITHDYEDTLEACGLSYEDLDERLIKLLLQARSDYLKECD